MSTIKYYKDLIKSGNLTVGVAPVSNRGALAAAAAVLEAGYRCVYFEPDESLHAMWAKALSNVSNSGFTVAPYDSRVNMCDITYIAGDYFGISPAQRQRYVDVLHAIGEQLEPHNHHLVVASGKFQPGFMDTVLIPELTLGGVLRVPGDLRIGLHTPPAFDEGTDLVAGDTDIIASVVRDFVYRLDSNCEWYSTVKPDVLESVPFVAESYKAVVGAWMLDMRDALERHSAPVNDAMSYAQVPYVNEPGILAPFNVRTHMDRDLMNASSSTDLIKLTRPALAIQERKSVRVVNAVRYALHAHNIKTADARVVIIGDQESMAHSDDEDWWRDLSVVKALDRADIRMAYYDVRKPRSKSGRDNMPRLKDMKSGVYQIAVSITAERENTQNSIARAILVMLDCCGVCDLRIPGVIQM